MVRPVTSNVQPKLPPVWKRSRSVTLLHGLRPQTRFVHVQVVVELGFVIIRATLNSKELFVIHILGVWYKQPKKLTYLRTKRPVKKHNEEKEERNRRQIILKVTSFFSH